MTSSRGGKKSQTLNTNQTKKRLAVQNDPQSQPDNVAMFSNDGSSTLHETFYSTARPMSGTQSLSVAKGGPFDHTTELGRIITNMVNVDSHGSFNRNHRASANATTTHCPVKAFDMRGIPIN